MERKHTPEIRFKGFEDEWEERKAGDIFTTTSDKGYPELPVLSATQDKGMIVRDSNVLNIQYDKKNATGYKRVRPGQFVIHLRSFQGGFAHSLVEGITSPAYTVLKFTNMDEQNDKYWKHLFKMDSFISSLDSVTYGVRDGRSINYKDYFELNHIIPKIDEQEKIGALFESLDDRLALEREKHQKLQEFKRAMLEKMFPGEGEMVPEIRFKGFEDEWEKKYLGDIMDITSVKRIHMSDWTNSGVRFFRARDIVAIDNNEKINDPLFISVEKYEEYSNLSGRVNLGDLLVTGVGSIGIPFLITDETPLYFKDGNIIWFKNENKISAKFFYYSFKSPLIQNFINHSSGVGTVGTYTIENGKKTPIVLPLDKEEQENIGNFFKHLDEKIENSAQKIEKIEEFKKSLMDKMFV